jgi:DNA-binding protein HU-beta
MNATDLADQIAGQHDLTKAAAKLIVEDFLKAIVETAAKGDEVSLPGFGKFKVQDKPARDGRNPKTGAAIKIAASRKLNFSPAKALKDALNPAPKAPPAPAPKAKKPKK